MIKEINIKEIEHLLRQLVQINTTQPDGHEAKLVNLIEKRYRNKPVELLRINHQSDRASLIIKLQGKKDQNAIAFVGHLDTVPLGDITQWDHNPFSADVQQGKLYGRGAADMKGGIAAMLLTLDHLLGREDQPEQTILFCFTADEEKNGIGALELVQHPAMAEVRAIVVCEPSAGKIGICEKGALWVKVIVEGISAHASRPDLGCNALEGLITFLAAARKAVEMPEQHPYLEKNTLSITTLHSGISQNIIPATAEATLDIRTLPGVSHQALLEKFQNLALEHQKELPSLSFEFEVINDRPSLETDASSPLVRLVTSCGKKSGLDLRLRGLYFYTDASQIVPSLNIPFVILGPGDDRQAHVINESIELAEVKSFAELYSRICLSA